MDRAQSILNGKKVMLVASNRAIRDLLAPMFNQIGAAGVRLSSGGDTVFKEIDVFRPDIIVCHQEQEAASAIAFIRMVRLQVSTPLALVLVLEQKDSGMGREAVLAGASGVLMIPFSVNDLKKIAETVLAEPQGATKLRFGPRPKTEQPNG